MNDSVVKALHIQPEWLEIVADMEKEELERQEGIYRGNKTSLMIKDRTVVLVDDGMATGSTMAAAIAAVEKMQAANIIIAVPVVAREVYDGMKKNVSDFFTLILPEYFYAVGLWYKDFSEVTDAEVRYYLEKSSRNQNIQIAA